jgi:hypothetical protein
MTRDEIVLQQSASFWILLLHLSPSFASRIAIDGRIKRP